MLFVPFVEGKFCLIVCSLGALILYFFRWCFMKLYLTQEMLNLDSETLILLMNGSL